MTEYKPWFEGVSSIIEQSNSEGVDYKSEYLRILEENIRLRLMIGDIVSEKCKLTN